MKIKSARFVRSAVSPGQCPPAGRPEVVLVGRSNVGKSSLINRLAGRRGLAKTSNTPGKTRTMNFYLINDAFYIVDLPGYGYARVPRELRKSWEPMTGRYLASDRDIRAAVFLLDARREIGESECELIDWLGGFGLEVVTVLTKADKLSRNALAARRAQAKRLLGLGDEGIIIFSAVTGQGREELWKALYALTVRR
ncbi:MAG TPA: YihA family ribosome biogenesis GTP-binding protein [Deltaproteobacteria bacterium]|nr:YihA family ribosome biogenesis GTP-binding protein [Deltaproteobacteria bacterium]